MHTLHEDVPKAISNVLSTHDWRGRKQLIDKLFVEDTKFWHLFFQCINRRELFGVYQMWGFYNFWIGVEYTRVVPDRKNHRVVVDLVETINVWWNIFPYLGIPIRLNLHVVLGTDPHPDPSKPEELIFTYQEDHIFWVESALQLNPILTLGLGPLFIKYLRPLAGSLYAAVGNVAYSRNLDVPNHLKREAKAKGFTNIEQDIQEAIHVAYGGSAKDKWDLSQKMYSEDAIFYHPLFVVEGKENIFGAHMFWASINRKTDARVKRIVLGENDDLAMVDVEQQFWPYLWWPGWPPLALWAHIILTLKDSNDGPGLNLPRHTDVFVLHNQLVNINMDPTWSCCTCSSSAWNSGKVIVQHEDHILWVESLLLRNLGPISRLYDTTIRRQIGIFFCWLGNTIYQILLHLSHVVDLFWEEFSSARNGKQQQPKSARTHRTR